ncbi:IS21 family transposase [Chitinophaga sancti]|uniref:IS21 family transposase n=1 Tax=Chitinophaga sancti TaxID=1004 RepID=UPI002A74D247|nr:IS21 family transposase [Chitinophaga sancti]WPQ61766.1 IS21 family transposase [Chitinophaga sancti]
MSKLKQIIMLRNEGTPLQTIAKAVSIARNTVKKYLRLIEIKGLDAAVLLKMEDTALEALLEDPDPEDQERLANLEELFPYFEQELSRTGVTRWILWGEYKQQYPSGFSYSRFCAHFSQWKRSRSATLFFEHQPADKLFIDFTGKKLIIVDRNSGQVTEVEVYVAVLGYSQLTYVQAVPSQRKEDFIMATENALLFIGGVPKALVPDNLKSAVVKADKYEPEVNPDFLDFANHYGITVLPARSYKPRDKAHVERAVNIAYSRIFAPLRNRVFYSIQTLNDAILELLNEHNNKPFQQKPISRKVLFEQEERHLLNPLPITRFELKKFKEATVMKNGYVQLSEDKHYYSVPYRFIGCKVKIIYSPTQVSVFYNKERIAYHSRSSKRYGHSTIHNHMSSSHQFVSEWNPDKFISWAEGISPIVQDYITHILETVTYPETAYRSCIGILSYEKKVGRQRLILAVQRATYYGAYNYTIIKRILQTGLEQIAFGDESTANGMLPAHNNIRGASEYK